MLSFQCLPGSGGPASMGGHAKCQGKPGLKFL